MNILSNFIQPKLVSRPESGISGLEKTAPSGELEFSSSSN